MWSARRRISRLSAVTSPMMRMARPGPGNGCRPTISSGRPSSRPTCRTSSLNSSRSGSSSWNGSRSGNPPTLWWVLMVPDAPALLLGIAHAREPLEERSARVHHPQIDPQVAAEGGLDLLALVQAQQAMVHEDAGEPVADGAMHQDRGHGRVHPARQSADDPLVGPDQLPDPLDFALHEVARRPVRRDAAD